MEYIEREDIFRELYNSELKSYKLLGLVDDSLFYPIIDNCLSILKIKSLVIKSQIIKINNFKGDLPDDFFKLKSIIKSNTYEYKYQNPAIQVEYEPVLCTERPCDPPLIGCNGNKYYLNQRFENYVIHLEEIRPLSVHTKSRVHCAKGFQNLSEEKITIENGTINTEFRDGIVFIVYESNENDGLIPDYPRIKQAIKTICAYEGFKEMFLNGEQDVLGRLQYLEPKAAIAENILRSIAKEQSFGNMMQMRQEMLNRYNIFDKMVTSKNNHFNYHNYGY